ncbi:hypothetical protein B0H14DRAFT_2659451 [Mycena olivaceomarginata]|nr:hypothetical protein B0H14DRAFT_2659451 [Mycena olivaceomarginata]
MNHVQKRRTEDIQIAQGQSAKHLNQFHSEVQNSESDKKRAEIIDWLSPINFFSVKPKFSRRDSLEPGSGFSPIQNSRNGKLKLAKFFGAAESLVPAKRSLREHDEAISLPYPHYPDSSVVVNDLKKRNYAQNVAVACIYLNHKEKDFHNALVAVLDFFWASGAMRDSNSFEGKIDPVFLVREPAWGPICQDTVADQIRGSPYSSRVWQGLPSSVKVPWLAVLRRRFLATSDTSASQPSSSAKVAEFGGAAGKDT